MRANPPRAHSERARRRANDDRREGQTYKMQYGGQNGGFGQHGDREKQRYLLMDARKSYTNTWATDPMSAPCTTRGLLPVRRVLVRVHLTPARPRSDAGRVRARAPDPAPRPAPDPRTSSPTAFFSNTESARVVGLFLTLLSSPLTPPSPSRFLPPPYRDSNVCVAYSQRKELMFNDLTNYTCCNGDFCISGRLGEKSCPEFCLCLEAFCCFPSAVATNRFMIQDEQRVENTQCDNTIIGFMLCLNQLACIFRCAAMISGNDELEQISDVLDCIADVTYCSVCACMQTQHHEQRARARPQRDAPPPRHNPMAPPGPMQMQQMAPPPHPHPQYAKAGSRLRPARLRTTRLRPAAAAAAVLRAAAAQVLSEGWEHARRATGWKSPRVTNEGRRAPDRRRARSDRADDARDGAL